MSLASVDYQSRATEHPFYRQISTDVSLSDLLLPGHLQLGPDNWLEFKHAVETVLRVKGIPLAHLQYSSSNLNAEVHDDAARRIIRERWAAEDEVCKTAIVLNVRKEHVRLAQFELERVSAAELWAALMQHDLLCRESAERKMRVLKVIFLLLLGMVLRLAYDYVMIIVQLSSGAR
ncbi:hypothetical protein C8Q74DRAFT_1194603 [Fomes fomentarius]|nr:hypothetical protein C8Q74DRAFT_1194603 [Fomes fomentarius]